MIDFLAAHSPTIGEALRRIAAYFRIVDPRAVLTLRGGALAFRARDAGIELPAPAQEYTFGALIVRARICAGAAWRPDAVELTFPEPEHAPLHRRVFGCEVRCRCAEARLVLSREALEAPVQGADPALLGVLEDHARRLVSELPVDDDLVSRVRAAIAEELTGGEPSTARIARRLAMSERTLQRRLQERRRTVAELLDETRAAVAKAYLRDRGMSLAEVAFLLGFSDQSAFTRAFRRWTGDTPGAWRR